MERLVERELGKSAAVLTVEQIPELRLVRQQAFEEAEELINSNRHEIGEFEPVYLIADPITAAERLLNAEVEYGKNSWQYEMALSALQTDNQRALAESYRKTTWEYFPPIEQGYDAIKGIFTAHGRPLLDITSGGLRWDNHAEERQRLANEYSEEVMYHQLAEHPLAESHWVLTISQCPDYAIDDSSQNYGYVPGIKKMMIRGVRINIKQNSFEPSSRLTEQVGLPGNIIDENIIHQALATIGAINQETNLNKTELHGTQILIDKSMIGGVIEFVKLLDDLAGDDIYMGEQQTQPIRDYSKVETQAKARQWLLKEQTAELTDFMIGLAKEKADHTWAAGQIQKKINELIHKRAQTNPIIAREAFDEATASGYERAIELDRLGKYQDAGSLRLKIVSQAPPAAYCGAGSCGLRFASSFEQSQGQRLGLIGDLILDTVRKCPSGHTNSVLYDSKGNKACRHCQKVQLKTRPKTYKPKPRKPTNKKSLFFS